MEWIVQSTCCRLMTTGRRSVSTALTRVLVLLSFVIQWSDSEIVMGDLGFGRLFQTKPVMGRLWDDLFRDLGYPPKFYRVQDAGFIGGSSIWWQIIIILKKNLWQIIRNYGFLKNDIITTKKNGRQAGHRSPDWGRTKTPIFNENLWKIKKTPEIKPPSTIKKSPYFWVCSMPASWILNSWFNYMGGIQIRRPAAKIF